MTVFKRIIYKLDIAAPNSWPRRAYERIERGSMRKRNPFCIEIMYRKNNSSELSRLCNLYGTDKGGSERDDWPWPIRTYADFYEMLFGQNRMAIRSVVECGLGAWRHADPDAGRRPAGASLRMWRDYFPHADIIGIDIDRKILFTDERITTYYCDQTDAQSVKDFVTTASLATESVDIIIDDGLHEFRAGTCLFENIFGLLKPDAVYVIEDIAMHDRKAYDTYFAARQDELSFQIVNLHRPKSALRDNVLIVIRKNR